jgi:hypothetical protein
MNSTKSLWKYRSSEEMWYLQNLCKFCKIFKIFKIIRVAGTENNYNKDSVVHEINCYDKNGSHIACVLLSESGCMKLATMQQMCDNCTD